MTAAAKKKRRPLRDTVARKVKEGRYRGLYLEAVRGTSTRSKAWIYRGRILLAVGDRNDGWIPILVGGLEDFANEADFKVVGLGSSNPPKQKRSPYARALESMKTSEGSSFFGFAKPKLFRPEFLLAEHVCRTLGRKLGEPDPIHEPVIVGMPQSLLLGLLVSALGSCGVKVPEIAPSACPHPAVQGCGAEHAECIVCGKRFTAEDPHPNCKPCPQCAAKTCVCGCGSCPTHGPFAPIGPFNPGQKAVKGGSRG